MVADGLGHLLRSEVEDLSVAVGEMRFLEELYLANNMRIGPKGLSQVLMVPQLARLRVLDLSNAVLGKEESGDDVVTAALLGDIESTFRFLPKSLEELVLTHSRLSGEGTEKLVHTLKTVGVRLVTLRLRSNCLADLGGMCLSPYVGDRLEVLDARVNKLGPRGLRYILQSAAKSWTSAARSVGVKTLRLGFNAGLDRDGAQAARSLLAAKPMSRSGIQVLDLTSANLGSLHSGTQEIAAGLAQNRSLQRLLLATNNLGPREAAVLAEPLEDNCVLEYLDLSDNEIGDEGVESLAEALKEQRTGLQRLLLARNGITDRGAAHLQSAAEQHADVMFGCQGNVITALVRRKLRLRLVDGAAG
jgi:Ran GTPase-activating protein (RanGAP) involved in mRNA processing and transport